MGTDIHIFTEVYITDPADSGRKIWYNADVYYKIPMGTGTASRFLSARYAAPL